MMSVSEMVDRNMRVTFDKVEGKDVSHVTDKITGECFAMERKSKVYELDFEVIPYQEAKETLRPASPFGRTPRRSRQKGM